jgi:hypothetical protein
MKVFLQCNGHLRSAIEFFCPICMKNFNNYISELNSREKNYIKNMGDFKWVK